MKAWHELYPKDTMPSEAEIEDYLGKKAALLWQEMLKRSKDTWKAKSKLTYSVCSGKPGWNLKLQKSGKSLGTLYPEPGSFSVFLVIPFQCDDAMQSALPELSPAIAQKYTQAEDFMKIGKWIMFQISSRKELEDFFRICELKLAG